MTKTMLFYEKTCFFFFFFHLWSPLFDIKIIIDLAILNQFLINLLDFLIKNFKSKKQTQHYFFFYFLLLLFLCKVWSQVPAKKRYFGSISMLSKWKYQIKLKNSLFFFSIKINLIWFKKFSFTSSSLISIFALIDLNLFFFFFYFYFFLIFNFNDSLTLSLFISTFYRQFIQITLKLVLFLLLLLLHLLLLIV